MTYSDLQRAEATTLALSYGKGGDKRAGRELGIPSRSIRRWMAEVRKGSPRGGVILIAESREQMAARSWSIYAKAMQRMDAALDDPSTPARDVARFAEVSFEQHALMTGGPTAHNVNLNVDPNPYAGMSPEEIQADWTRRDAEAKHLREALEFMGELQGKTDEELAEYLQSSNFLALMRDENAKEQIQEEPEGAEVTNG